MSRRSDNPNAVPAHSESRGVARNSKRTGELSEAAFLHKAVGLGFR